MKLAFGVRDLSHTQLAYYIVRESNKFLSKRSDIDISIFFEEPSCSSIPLLFSSMQFAEGWGYNGTLVSTSFSTAQKALGFPCAKKRYFLVWDFEWITGRPQQFRYFQNVYSNPKHELLARTEEHADILSSLWNVKRPKVVNETNLVEDLLKE